MQKKTIRVLILTLTIMMLSACNLRGNSTPTAQKAELVFTSAAQTVSARLTQDIAAKPTQPVATPTPSNITLTPILSPSALPATNTLTPLPPQATTASAACDEAEFVADVTIPDGTTIQPGTKFTKTWQIRNSGTCTWKTTYSLVFSNGEQMGAAASVNLVKEVKPQEIIDISVLFTAPTAPGAYASYWKLANASGGKFGVRPGNSHIWVKIIVGGNTFTPTITGTPPTATPTLLSATPTLTGVSSTLTPTSTPTMSKTTSAANTSTSTPSITPTK